MEGVVRTRVGYCGGTTSSPTYRSIGDHAESVQMDFDPKKLSYEDLLAVFWEAHDPTARAWSRQYMSAIFYGDETQKQAANKSKEVYERLHSKVSTEIAPLEKFFIAEDYHQKYYLRNTPALMKEFSAFYPRPADFAASTAAARVNGYLDGCGAPAQVQAGLKNLGLPLDAQSFLLKRVGAQER